MKLVTAGFKSGTLVFMVNQNTPNKTTLPFSSVVYHLDCLCIEMKAFGEAPHKILLVSIIHRAFRSLGSPLGFSLGTRVKKQKSAGQCL